MKSKSFRKVALRERELLSVAPVAVNRKLQGKKILPEGYDPGKVGSEVGREVASLEKVLFDASKTGR